MDDSKTSSWLEVAEGTSPLLFSIPHSGEIIPSSLSAGLVDPELALRDTDWYIDRIFDRALIGSATLIKSHISRTVIDVNRDPSGESLYPGMPTTGLCPLTCFDGRSLYRRSQEPSDHEIARRLELYHAPYIAAIQTQVSRLRDRHPRVVVIDCHSIRHKVSRLFEGSLPALNLGTNRGATVSIELAGVLRKFLLGAQLSNVLNGRFKGGWITRHFGRPETGVHAIQIEVAMNTYLTWPEPEANRPNTYDSENGTVLRRELRGLIDEVTNYCRSA